MFAFLPALFTGLVLIIKFLKNVLIKFVSHGVIITFQFGVTASTIAFALIFYGFAITSFIALYNYGYEIASYTSNQSSLSCMMGLLDIIGFLPACNTGYTILFASLSTVFAFKLMHFTFWITRIIANEVFKLGVLLGQALS